MFAIVGAAGKIGYATCVALREAQMPVRAVVRRDSNSAHLRAIGCEVKVADLHDSEALANAIDGVETVQVIVPPSVQADDGARQMRIAIESIGSALEKVKPRRVLAISDYGAHVDHDIGMPTMCGALEARISNIKCHRVILRSAEHMQNWARAIPAAVTTDTLRSFPISPDMPFPAVSAPDVGQIAARILLQPVEDDKFEVVHAEGPQRYSVDNVAAALSQLLGREIRLEISPRSQWKDALELAMSPSLAELLIKANDALNKGGLIDVDPSSGKVCYGTTALIDGLRPLLPL